MFMFMFLHSPYIIGYVLYRFLMGVETRSLAIIRLHYQ